MRHTQALGLILVSLFGIGTFMLLAPRQQVSSDTSVASVASPNPAPDSAALPAPAPRAEQPATPQAHTVTLPSQLSVVASTTETATPLAHLTISHSGTAVYPIEAADGTTLIDAMRTLTASGLTFMSHEYPGMGTFIDSIQGVANADGYYWILYHNGSKSSVGASSIVLHQGDSAEWRYEKGY